MEQLYKIISDRLGRRGLETSNLHAYMRDLVNTYTAHTNFTIQELNKKMNSLGWNEIELDEHTLQLIMAVTENNKTIFKNYWEVEKTQNYLKFPENGYTYLKTSIYNESKLLPVPENSIVQQHIRDFNKVSGFLK